MYVMEKYKTIEQLQLEQAITAVREKTGLDIEVSELEAYRHGKQIDGFVRIKGRSQIMAVEIKKWAQQANLGALINQIKQLPETGLLVADYINPKMAEKLWQEKVQFIDTTGNAYIDLPPVYVYVTGNRQQKAGFMPTTDGARRAFEPTGLKVVYTFLCHPELVNAPYRKIAEEAGVALGTVGWVLNGLKAADFVRGAGGKKDRCLVHYRKLLDRWVEAWPEKLRPKQLTGEFIAEDPYWWKGIDIREYDGYWGGEIAAAKYTNYLKPKVATIYMREHLRNKLLLDVRLRKATEWAGIDGARMKIYRPFWPENFNEIDTELRKGLVHPVLVYADLVATGDARNLEVAQRIYNEHIAQHIRED